MALRSRVSNSPVGCYLVRGSHPVGMSTGEHAAEIKMAAAQKLVQQLFS